MKMAQQIQQETWPDTSTADATWQQRRGPGFWSRFRRQPAALVGAMLLLLLLLIALGADRIAPYDPFATSDEVLTPLQPRIC
jgi:ABC-type antimicrobial peptide transport system permease subunit